jgi:hypothetical protein
MNHLSDEQLSGLLDDALPPGERTACDAHLAGCHACRTRLADASALDASLSKALKHDPGEAYFADFAGRVAKQIADRRIDATLETHKPAMRSIWAWLTSPRGLALAGSTAALLLVAGVAWMRFHNEQDVGRALREATPRASLERRSAPRANDELRSAPVAPSSGAPVPTASTAQPPSNAAAPPRDLARMQEVRTLPNGERVPVEAGAPERQGNALAAPAAGSAIAQMKRRSLAPAAEGAAGVAGAAKAESAPREEAQASKDIEAAAPPAAAPPAATFAKEPPAARQRALTKESSHGQTFSAWGANKSLEGGTANEPKSDAKLMGVMATCGKVRDSRGRAVAGAEITAIHDGVRTARTDAEGAFCVDDLAAGDTLIVMHVGFDPWTVVMTPMTSLAITLEPVGTLGPNATMLTGKPQASSPTLSGALHANANAPADTASPPPDPYAGLSFGIHQLVRDARDATVIAQHEATATSYEKAAKQWAAVLGQVKGAPAHDASFQYVAALRTAYQLDPTSTREGRLRSAMKAFLATTPLTLPEHATVTRWLAELDAAPGR